VNAYGCGQLAGCESMLFYRSATLGYFDLSASSEGTQNFGGIRPGCWINAIPAGGMLLVPDASSGCAGSDLDQAWLAVESASCVRRAEPDQVRAIRVFAFAERNKFRSTAGFRGQFDCLRG